MNVFAKLNMCNTCRNQLSYKPQLPTIMPLSPAAEQTPSRAGTARTRDCTAMPHSQRRRRGDRGSGAVTSHEETRAVGASENRLFLLFLPLPLLLLFLRILRFLLLLSRLPRLPRLPRPVQTRQQQSTKQPLPPARGERGETRKGEPWMMSELR